MELLVMEQCWCMLCEFETLKVKWKEADKEDFVSSWDIWPYDEAFKYWCSNYCADPKWYTQEVLDKYWITPDEYSYIAREIAGKLSFWGCACCI
jgi:hypothetical protein